jgi:CHASE2 domain-containing sensor protein
MNRTAFKLRIRQIASLCDFELSWGKGQILTSQLEYSPELIELYKQWKNAYLNYYQHLRGRVKKIVTITPSSQDWRSSLVQAQAKLLDRFHQWLLCPALAAIRRQIAQAAIHSETRGVDVFLTCTPLELARLPWETWEIGTDLGTVGKIRIARTPNNILCESVHPLRRKVRVLAILGEDNRLNFTGDWEVLQQKLSNIAEIRLDKEWKKNEEKDENLEAVLSIICQAIADKRGWDILFFAGHSNETELTGGEISIAPKLSISIREIEPALRQAKQNGLQFAIFNSCNGINIAESLINLGLNQVVVMREPIHNQVAGEFIQQFLESLSEFKDAHEAMQDACEFLQQQEKRIKYPSASLIPSIFRHPEAELFRLKQQGWKLWLPSSLEAFSLLTVVIFSLLIPVQEKLLEFRLFAQAIYRFLIQPEFISPLEQKSPVLIVQVDQESIKSSPEEFQEICPINYSYLAKLLTRLSQLKAHTIGIDYILDQDQKQPENTDKLAQAVRNSIQQNTWFVFGAVENEEPQLGVSDRIASLNWSLEGDIYFFTQYLELLPNHGSCVESCPFSYLLALIHQLKADSSFPNFMQPNLQNNQFFRSTLFQALETVDLDQKTQKIYNLKLPLTASFFQWLHPIIDYSFPPTQVYETISAQDLLTGQVPPYIDEQVIIIAPGGHPEAGLNCQGKDNFSLPLAVKFWGRDTDRITGGEIHAYMVHHILRQRFVVAIPDVWMIGLAAIFGKGTLLFLGENLHQRKYWIRVLKGATVVYILVGLQIYMSPGILIPYFFPLVVFWTYVSRGKSNDDQ